MGDFHDDDKGEEFQLVEAAYEGNRRYVQEFLNAGVNVNAKVNFNSEYDDLEEAALHVASGTLHLDIIKLLVENYNADINIRDTFGQTPLHKACAGEWLGGSSPHLKVVQFLIEHGADIQGKDEDGTTPLHVACSESPLEISKFLIENGADVDAKENAKGKTPLHIALEDLELIKLLVEAGANANVEDACGRTPLDWACEFWVVYDNDVSVDTDKAVELLIRAGAAVNNFKDGNFGASLLHWACLRHNLDMITLLIECGADLHSTASSGKTPLHWTITSYPTLEIVKLLIENGANVNAKDNRGNTPLHEACSQNLDGETPLHLEIDYFINLDTARLLIENGANVNAKDNDGKTPMHLACKNGDLEKVQLLLSRGAIVVNMKTTNGSTPLHVAAEHNHVEVIWYLVRQNPSMVLERLE